MIKCIYETPADWGDAQYRSEQETLTDIRELKKLGEEWQGISINNCNKYELVAAVDENTGIYQMSINNRLTGYAIFRISAFGGYDFVANNFNSADEAAEYLAE